MHNTRGLLGNNYHRNRYNFWWGSVAILVEYARYQIVERKKAATARTKRKKNEEGKNQ